MTAKQSSDVDKAMAILAKPKRNGKKHDIYAIAEKCNVSPSTIYRAIKRAKGKK